MIILIMIILVVIQSVTIFNPAPNMLLILIDFASCSSLVLFCIRGYLHSEKGFQTTK